MNGTIICGKSYLPCWFKFLFFGCFPSKVKLLSSKLHNLKLIRTKKFNTSRMPQLKRSAVSLMLTANINMLTQIDRERERGEREKEREREEEEERKKERERGKMKKEREREREREREKETEREREGEEEERKRERGGSRRKKERERGGRIRKKERESERTCVRFLLQYSVVFMRPNFSQ